MKITLLLSLITFNALAMDCGGIPEGQIVRIDNGSGSLAKAALQDQDGIGSCYANQASLLLQSVIPDSPNLSYLNLALFYTADQKKKQRKNNLVNNSANADADKEYTKDITKEDGSVVTEGGSGIWGGFACDTINLAKEKQKASKSGSLCKAEDVALEHNFFNSTANHSVDPNQIQEKSLLQASKYMNTFQKNFGAPLDSDTKMTKELKEKRQKADDFSNALKNFVANSSNTFFSDKCTAIPIPKVQELVTNAMVRVLDANPKCIERQRVIRTDLPVCRMINQIGSLEMTGAGMSSKIAFKLNDNVSNGLTGVLPLLFEGPGGFKGFMEGMNNFLKDQDKAKVTKANKPAKDAFNKNVSESFSPKDLSELESIYKKVALKEIDECKQANMLEYFKDKNQFLELAKKDSVLCNYSELLSRAADLANVIPEKTFNNMSSFVDFLTAKAGLNYDDAIMSIMAQDCTPDKRLSIPETVKCESERILFSTEDVTPALSQKAQRTIKANRDKMMANLQSNRAIGLDLCTKFWNDPTYDLHGEDSSTKYNSCSATGKHGFHAITMVGYRCKDSRIQYLAQNSWGPNWKAEPYETENGKIWLDEDKLFKNLDRINYINP